MNNNSITLLQDPARILAYLFILPYAYYFIGLIVISTKQTIRQKKYPKHTGTAVSSTSFECTVKSKYKKENPMTGADMYIVVMKPQKNDSIKSNKYYVKSRGTTALFYEDINVGDTLTVNKDIYSLEGKEIDSYSINQYPKLSKFIDIEHKFLTDVKKYIIMMIVYWIIICLFITFLIK